MYPYTDGTGLHGLDPAIYLKMADQKDPDDVTIIDKFTRQAPSSKVWATEIVNQLKLSQHHPPEPNHVRHIHSLILNSNERLLYAVDYVSSEVIVVRDLGGMYEIGKLPLDGELFKSALDLTMRNVCVADFMGDTVTVINAITVLTTITQAYIHPYGARVNPLNSCSKTLTILGY